MNAIISESSPIDLIVGRNTTKAFYYEVASNDKPLSSVGPQ